MPPEEVTILTFPAEQPSRGDPAEIWGYHLGLMDGWRLGHRRGFAVGAVAGAFVCLAIDAILHWMF